MSPHPRCELCEAVGYREGWDGALGEAQLAIMTVDGDEKETGVRLGHRQAARGSRKAMTALDAFLASRVNVRLNEVADAFGYTRRHIELEIQRGKLKAVGQGRTRRVTIDSIRQWAGQGQPNNERSTPLARIPTAELPATLSAVCVDRTTRGAASPGTLKERTRQ